MTINTQKALEILIKGLAALPVIIKGGGDIVDRIGRMQKLAEDIKAGRVTKEQIAAIRAQLDADLDEFNS